MTARATAGAGRRGRPFDRHVDAALLRSAREVLLERGFHDSSLAEIARRAGVGVPTLYRRWPSKAATAIAVAVSEMRPEPIPDTGSIRDDLAAFVRLRIAQFGSPLFHKVLLPLILEVGSGAPEVAAATAAYRYVLHRRLHLEAEAGGLRPGVDPERVLDMLMGAVVTPIILSNRPPDVAEAEAIVDQLLDGIRP